MGINSPENLPEPFSVLWLLPFLSAFKIWGQESSPLDSVQLGSFPAPGSPWTKWE